MRTVHTTAATVLLALVAPAAIGCGGGGGSPPPPPPCEYALSASSFSVSEAGGTSTVAVSTRSGCPWSAASDSAWITVTAGASGRGDGTVQYSVAPNPSSSPRSGSLTIAGLTFTVDQTGASCTYALLPESASFTAAGGSATVSVAAPEGCPWAATSDSGWLTLVGTAEGSGDGPVQVSVAPNAGSASRSGTIDVAGRPFTVTQGGTACTYVVAPAAASVPAVAGSGSFTITAPSGCAWGAGTSAGWITITSGTAGSGSGGVQYDFDPNPAASVRQGDIAVSGETHTVTQAAAACAYALLPGSASVPAGGGVGSFTVSAPAGCGWTATSSHPWLAVTSGASGDGTRDVAYAAAANAAAVSRTATITAGGETFTVTQGGAGCSYELSASSASVGAGGASVVVNVTAVAGCAWSSSSGAGWIDVVGGASGEGSGTVQLAIDENPAGIGRSGTVTIAGQPFTVEQAEAPCTYALVPETASFTAAGGAGSVAVDTLEGCGWTATSDSGWLALAGTVAGSGDGSVRFSVAENAGGGSRTGTLTVAGRSFTVAQGGASCTYALSPAAASVGAGAAAGSVEVAAPGGCTWTAAADVPWITFPSGAAGEGSATLAYAVGANPAAVARGGAVTVAGEAHAVSQAAAACVHAILPSSGSYPPAGAIDEVAVSAPAGCPWAATSGAGWVTVASGTPGDGPGTVRLSIAANAAAGSRSTTVTIAGEPFAVTQGGVSCTYAIDPTGVTSVAAGGGGGTVLVTAPAGCAWTSAASDPWIEVAGSGSGDGSASWSVAANAATAPRAGSATIAGRTFTVTQVAKPCAYSLSPSSATLGAAPGSGALSVLTSTECAWTAASNDPEWLTVTSGASGTGRGLVGFAVPENGGDVNRTGTLTVAGQTFTVTQRWGGDVIIIIQ